MCVRACVNSLIDTCMAGAFAKDKKAAEAEQKKLDRAFINDDEEESGDEESEYESCEESLEALSVRDFSRSKEEKKDFLPKPIT